MRLALLGAPGSGKATQAKLLVARHRVAQVSVRELLRESAKTRVAKTARTTANDNVIKLLEERLRARDSKRGFIIGDFPRNIPQAQALDTLLGMLGRAVQIAICLKVDDETLVKRITGRMQCAQCGARYNRHYFPPQRHSTCDDCDGNLTATRHRGRKAVSERIALHHQESVALNSYYKAQHKLRTVLANESEDTAAIHRKICDIVDLEIRPLEVTTIEIAAEAAKQESNTVIAGGQINRIESPPTKRVTRTRAVNNTRAESAPTRNTPTRNTKATAAKNKIAKPAVDKKSAPKATAHTNKKSPPRK